MLVSYEVVTPSEYNFKQSLLLSSAFKDSPYYDYPGYGELLSDHKLLNTIINKKPDDLSAQEKILASLREECFDSVGYMGDELSNTQYTKLQDFVKTKRKQI